MLDENKDDYNACIINEKNPCRNAYYLEITEEPTYQNVFAMSCTWILIFTNLVPISLMVSLEMVKFFQAIFMTTDILMYDRD